MKTRVSSVRWLCILAVLILFTAVGIFYFSKVRTLPDSQESAGAHQSADSSSVPARQNPRKEEKPGAAPQKTPESGFSSQLTPEVAKERLLQLESDPDINSRSKAMAEVIKKLCQAGYGKEAWELIENQAGRVRDSQLYAFFYEAKMNETEALSLMQKLDSDGYKGDLPTAITAYMERLDPKDIEGLADTAGFGKLAEAMKADSPIIFQNLMESYFLVAMSRLDAKRQPEILAAAEDFHAKGLIADEDLYNIFKHGESVNAFTRWQMLNDAIAAPGEAVSEERQALVKQIVQADAKQAVDLISGSDSQQTTADLSTAIRQWVIQEPAGASDWYQANEAKLTSQCRDAAAAAFTSSAIVFNERESALQWVERISDPEMKKNMLGQIAEKFPKKP